MRYIPAIAAALGLTVPNVAPLYSAGVPQQQKQTKEERKRAEQEAIRQAVRRGELLPLPRILAIAQARVPGDVVKVELEHEKGTIIYEIKILTAAGRVREVKLNARTGAVVKIEDD